jgi:hypothetical protein
LHISHVDEFIENLLWEERECDIILPRLIKRSVLEETDQLEPRVSILDDELEESSDSEEEGEQPAGFGFWVEIISVSMTYWVHLFLFFFLARRRSRSQILAIEIEAIVVAGRPSVIVIEARIDEPVTMIAETVTVVAMMTDTETVETTATETATMIDTTAQDEMTDIVIGIATAIETMIDGGTTQTEIETTTDAGTTIAVAGETTMMIDTVADVIAATTTITIDGETKKERREREMKRQTLLTIPVAVEAMPKMKLPR